MVVSTQASAELVTKDYAVEGDGLITFDTSTGLEWLDLSQTLNHTINSITPYLDTRYEGFEVAHKSQIDQMVLSVMPTIFTADTFHLDRDGSGSDANSPLIAPEEGLRFRTLFRNAGSHTSGAFLHNEPNASGYTAGLLGSNPWVNGNVAYYDLRLDNDDYAMSRFFGTNYHGHSGVYLVSSGGYSYSSLNDEEMKQIQSQNFGDVSAPLGMGVGVLAMMVAGSLSRRKE